MNPDAPPAGTGTPDAAGPGCWRTALFLAGLMVALWVLPAGLWHLSGNEEATYGHVARTMATGGNWLVPTINGDPCDRNAPLGFIPFALASRAAAGTLALRAPALLAAIALVLLTWRIGRRLLNERAAILSALILATIPLFADLAPRVGAEMLFALLTCAAIGVYLLKRRDGAFSPLWAAAYWGLLSAAVLTNGPLALIVALSIPAWEAAATRSWTPLAVLRPWLALPMLVVPVVAWSVVYCAVAGIEPTARLLASQTVDRITGTDAMPFFHHVPEFFVRTAVPWAFLFPVAFLAQWKATRENPSRRPLLAWFLAPFAFLCFLSEKRVHDILPLLPAVALLTGWYVDRTVLAARERPVAGRTFAAAALLGSLACIAAFVVHLTMPGFLWNQGIMLRNWHLGLIGGAAVVWLAVAAVVWKSRWKTTAILAGTFVFLASAQFIVFPLRRAARDPFLSPHLFVERLGALAHSHGSDTVAATEEASLPVYHVGATYGIQRLQGEVPLFLRSDELSPVFVALADEWDAAGGDEQARQEGFRKRFEGEVGGARLVVAEAADEVLPGHSGRTSVSLAFLGDVGTGKRPQFRIGAQTALEWERDPFDAIVLLGDNLYGDGQWEDILRDDFLEPFDPIIRLGIPFITALGNHDVRSGKREGEMNDPLFGMGGRSYYSQTFGDEYLTIFVTDSDFMPHQPEQVLWLRNELAWNQSVWKILVSHHPLSATPSEEDPRDPYREVLPIWSVVLEDQRVDLIASGHNHMYERRKAVEARSNVDAFTMQIIGGNSGELWDEPGLPATDPDSFYMQSIVRSFVRIDFDGREARGRTITEYGQIIDEWTMETVEEGEGVVVVDEKSEEPFLPPHEDRNAYPAGIADELSKQ